ncbi:MAG TPA: hypothetical protein VJ836_04925 [Candidatus Saccharimonadales bacterium]|nr:hypothetical protein [Candidatus Saccharimonadales bacterium]
MERIAHRIYTVLGSHRFYAGVIVFLALEALWVAVSSAYPMAFDEEVHLGTIKIYAAQWSPFLASQPEGADAFGAIVRDPSYLFHYLLSFPYRFIVSITGSEAIQVVFLRFINIALFVWGVALFRKVLIRVGTSAALTHTAIALFALVPIVPLLAGQINYDNLLMPLAAWICLLVISLYKQLRTRTIDLRTVALFVLACMLTAIVKYAFLPMAAAAVLFVAVMAIRSFGGAGPAFNQAVVKSYQALGIATKTVLIAGLFISGVLFAQRYVVNLALYHTPVPSCDAVLSQEDCMAYGPWARNYLLAQQKGEVNTSPLAYTSIWLQSLHYRMFFMVSGPNNGFVNYPPVLLPSATAVVIAIFALTALACCGRRVFAGRGILWLFVGMAVLYCGVLWTETYGQYLETGEPVAINGRYLIPLLLPMATVFGRALSVAFRPWPAVKSFIAVGVILLFLQGGGVFSFISRSNHTWYWSSRAVHQMNESARNLFDPVMYEGRKYY